MINPKRKFVSLEFFFLISTSAPILDLQFAKAESGNIELSILNYYRVRLEHE
jgi:hypothetical protein